MSKFKLSPRTRVKIRTFYRRIAVMFTSLIYISCSYTSGGTYIKKIEREPTGNQIDETSKIDSANSSTLGSEPDAKPDITGTPSYPDSSTRSPSATSNVSPSGTTPSNTPVGSTDTSGLANNAEETGTGEWMADAAVCHELAVQIDRLKASPGPDNKTFQSRILSMQDYLCTKDGLDIMRDTYLDKPNINLKSKYPLIAIEEIGDFNKHQNGLANVQVGGASFHKKAKVSNVVEISKLYCKDFHNAYVPLYPAVVFEGVNSVATRNHDNQGNCDYTFKGKKILNFITPQYEGSNKVKISQDGRIAILFNFLTSKKASSFLVPTTVHEM